MFSALQKFFTKHFFTPANTLTAFSRVKAVVLSFFKYPTVEILVILLLLAPLLLVLLVALSHSATFVAAECGPLLQQILLPGLMLVCSAAVPLLRTPISSLICLLGLFATAAVLYLLAGAEYFANVSFIVSIGGVAIIFLFVIMLLDPKGLKAKKKPFTFDLFYTTALLVGALLFFRVSGNVETGLEQHFTYNTLSYPTEQDLFRAHMETDILVFRSLFGDDWALFALITLILLLSMLAAIIIATLSTDPHVERAKAVQSEEKSEKVHTSSSFSHTTQLLPSRTSSIGWIGSNSMKPLL